MFCISSGFSQNIANNDLIGVWNGPNGVLLTLNSNGTGNSYHGPLECSTKIVSWSATATTLNIHWDITPIECLKLQSTEKFTYNPKIEFDKPEYTITKERKTIGGINATVFTLKLNNKEFNSVGYYTRAGDVEIPE